MNAAHFHNVDPDLIPVDRVNKVEQILDYLTNEVKDSGLGHILSSCQQELKAAAWDLGEGAEK